MEDPTPNEHAGVDKTSPSTGDEGGSGGSGREWLWKLVVPVAVVVVGGLLAAALGPAGAGLRERLFPTRAAVSGSVLVDGQPAAGADLTLDGKDRRNADAGGKFLLERVRAGTHRLHLQAVGAQPREIQFAVQRGIDELDVGAIKLEPLFQLGYVASLGAPRFTRGPGQSSPFPAVIDYDLTLWIVGDPAMVRRIRSVSYTLPAPLPSDPVPGRPARRVFCYRQAGELFFQDLMVIGGAFATATAIVDLGDGRPFRLSAQPGEHRPPVCPVTQAAQVRPPAPMPAPSPAPTPAPNPAPTPAPTTSTAPGPLPTHHQTPTTQTAGGVVTSAPTTSTTPRPAPPQT
jgi:hypothetical protein